MQKIKIKALFEANDSTYGYRRLHAALARGGESAGPEPVRRLMRQCRLACWLVDLGLGVRGCWGPGSVHDRWS
jgi:hypothetical protein